MSELFQRALTDLVVHYADKDVPVRHVIPFWDREWTVRFALLAPVAGVLGTVPMPAESASPEALTLAIRAGAARPLADHRPADFAGLYHYDEAAMMRDTPGLPEAVRFAGLRTNLAGKAKSGTEKIHEVQYDGTLGTVVRVATLDRIRVTRWHGKGELEFSQLR